MDRVSGLKQNIEEFRQILMAKLFSKKDVSSDFKFLLKRDISHQRTDNSKPLYLDDLKRF